MRIGLVYTGWVPAPFDLPFVQRGVVEVLLLAVGSGFLGTWIVLRGLSFYAHAVGTAAFPGLVLADGLGFSPLLGALATAGIVAVGVTALAGRGRAEYDSATALVLVAALAGGVILASDVFHSQGSVERLLFGSLLLVDRTDQFVAAVVGVAAVGDRRVARPALAGRVASTARARGRSARGRACRTCCCWRSSPRRRSPRWTRSARCSRTALLVVPAATTRLRRRPHARAGRRRRSRWWWSRASSGCTFGGDERAARRDDRRRRRRRVRAVARPRRLRGEGAMLLRADGLAAGYGGTPVLATSRSTPPPASASPSSAPTAAARPRCSARCSASCGRGGLADAPGARRRRPADRAVAAGLPGLRPRRRADGHDLDAAVVEAPAPRRPRRAPRRRSRTSASPTAPTAPSATSPAASASGCSSPARSSRTRPSCCSTSPTSASTRPAPRCSTTPGAPGRQGRALLIATHDVDQARDWERCCASTAARSRSARPRRR